MREKTSSVDKRTVSLSFKLNLLITVIVLVVSMMLINITYHSFTSVAYSQIHDRLDRVNTEELLENTSLQNRCAAFCDLTHLNGFSEAREASEDAKNSDPLYVWLKGYWIHDDNGQYWTEAEQEAVYEALCEEAEQANVPADETVEWILETHMDFFKYGEAASMYYYDSHTFSSEAEKNEFSHVCVYAEDGDGCMRLYDAVSPAMQGESYDRFLPYGERLDHAAVIEAYKQHPDELYTSYESENGPEMAKIVSVSVTSADGRDIRLFFVYSIETAKVEEGRRDFLLRSLLLVGIMMIAAIVVSLLILRRMATKPLRQLSEAVEDFSIGQANGEKQKLPELNIKSSDEIGKLSRNIRSMQDRILADADSLTRMTAEKERIATELDLATRIQTDMLPNIFPAFPDRKDFDIYATMDPAKAVGGDFYDFFLVDQDHLALVIADVSGKGIPAALFMMISKIMLQDRTKTGLSPAKVLEQVNAEILENNNEDMFVTVWLGVLELSTGKLIAANAGHEYPFVTQPDGSFALFKDPHGFVLASMPDMKYQNYELQLVPGSKLFVYTDGVPEATNAAMELFGSERLLAALNECAGEKPEKILRHVRESVDAFVGEAEQFDDLTMLCLEYKG